MAIFKRALIALAILLLIPTVVLAAALFYLTTAPGLATIASLTSEYASSDDTKISVGGIEGSFPYDLTVKDIRLADQRGEWLTLDRARVVWSPMQLWTRKLTVNLVDVGHVTVIRPPVYPEKNDPLPPPDPNAPLFPELPIEIHLEKFALANLDLAGPVLGAPARIAAHAAATIRQPSQGVSAEFDVRRIDGTEGQIGGRGRFVPATNNIELSLRGSEPAGGLVARIASIPGLPPIDIGLEGAGTLDALRTQLVLTAGGQGRIDGAADVKREGKTRRVKIALNGEVGRLVQPEIAALLDGMTKIDAEAIVPDQGPIQLLDARIDAPAAKLGVRGSLDPEKETVDLAYDVRAGELTRFAGLLPAGVRWGALTVAGTAKGPLDHPEIKATLDGTGIGAEPGGADAAKVVLSLAPNGPLSDEATKVAVVVDATADGVKFADDRLFSLGRSFSLSAAAVTNLKGEADIARSEVKLADIRATYTGTASPDAAKGKATLVARDLSTLAPLAGRPLAGSVDLATDIDVLFDLSRLAVALNGTGSGLVTGVPQADALTGGKLALKGGVTRAEDGSFAFQDFSASGDHVRVTANGSANRERADAKILAEVDDLALVDARAAGKAIVTADLSGRLDALGLKAVVSIPEGRALEKSLKDIRLTVDAVDVTGDVGAQLALAGSLAGKAVSGGGRLVTEPSGQRRIEGLDLKLASTSLKGDLAIAPNALAAGKLTVAAPDLSEVGALALTELAGKLDADIGLSAEGGVQKIVVKANGADVVAPGAKLGALDVAATLLDPAGKLTIDGTVRGSAIAVGGQVVDSLSVVAKGAPDGMDVALDMGALGSSAAARARVAYAGDETRIDLSRLDLAGGGKTAALNAPARIRVVGSEVAIDAFALRAGDGGVLNVTGRAGKDLDLALGLRQLPLALGNAFTPGLDLRGMVDGEAKVTGAASAPAATYDMRVSDLSIAKLRDAKVPPLGISARGRLEGPRLFTDVAVAGAGGISVTAQGSAPIGEGDLDMTVAVRSLPLAIANAFMPELGFGGRLEGDARLNGPVAEPRGTYRARIVDFTSARAKGVPAILIEAKGQIEGDRVTTDTLISGGGGIRASAKGTAPLGQGDVDMDVAIRELPLALANAFVPDLGLGGSIKGAARVHGPVVAPRGTYDLQVDDLISSRAAGLPALKITTKGALEGPRVTTDTVVSGGGGLSLVAKGSAPLGQGDLDIAVDVREFPLAIGNAVDPSLGLGGELRGDARVTGPISAPRGTYALKVSDLVAAAARGVPPLQVDARGALEGTHVNTSTVVTGGGLDVLAEGRAPLGDGPLDMAIAIRELPLSIANAFAPEAGLGGTLRGSAKLVGPVKALGGTYDITITDLTSAPARGVPALQVAAKGALEPKRVTTDALITGGGGVELAANGAVPIGEGDIDLSVALKSVPVALANAVMPQAGLAGTLKGDAKIGGTVAAPRGSYAFEIVDLTAKPAKGVPALKVVTRGDLDGQRVTTDTELSGGGGVSLTAKGSAPLNSSGDLDMAVAIRELPLALVNAFKPELGLAGSLRGDAKVSGPLAGPQGTYDLTINGLTAAQAKGVPALEVKTRGALQGERVMTDTEVSGGGGVSLTAKGSAPLSATGDLDLAIAVREVPLSLANAVKPELGLGGVIRGDAKIGGSVAKPQGTYDLTINGLTAAQAKGVPALQVVTRGALEADRVTTDTEVSGGGGVSLSAKGSAPLSTTGDLDMTVAIREIPLAVANAFAPSLGLAGKLRGDAKVGGKATAPQGTYDITITGLTSAQAKGVPALQVVTRGTLEGQRVTTDTAITGGGGIRATAKGAAPIGPGDLDMIVDVAELPLSIANGFVPGIGLNGKLTANAQVKGPLAAPGGRYDVKVSGLTSARAVGVPALQIAAKGDMNGGRVTTDAVVTGGGGLRVTARGSAPAAASGPLDMDVTIRSVPLSLANGFSPGLGANGTLQGDAKIGGTIAAPTGTYTLKVNGLSTSATRGAGVPAAQIDSKGRLDGQRVVTDTTVTAAGGLRVVARGSAPLGAGNLDLNVDGTAPLGFLNDTLSVSGDQISGAATFKVNVGGPASAPKINGTANLANAAYTNRASGLQLRAINAAIAANGTNIEVRSLRATTRNGGTISGSGRVAVDPAGGFPGEIRFTANNAEVVGTDIVTAITDADLRLQGPLARRPVVNGTIRTRSIEIQIPDRIPVSYTPLPDVRHRAAPPQIARQMNARNTGAKKGGAKEEGFVATLNIDVQAENRIFIRGMGMQAEAGGQIKVAGTSAKPEPVGAFQLRQGRSAITVIGKRLNFTRGEVSFAGDLDPTLDFLAETPAGNITAQVLVTGLASRPKIEFASNPSVPQDEVLSRLLFNKASGELSPSQALTLAQAVAQYSGVGGGGGGPLESLRKGLGVDSLDIAAGGEGGPGLGVGRYISDNIYLGLKSGTTPESTGVTVDIDLGKNIKARGEAGSAGNTAAGVAVEWDY